LRWGTDVRRRFFLIGVDLFWVAISPFVALFIRDNFSPRAEALSAAIGYAGIGVLVAAIILPVAGLNRGLWRYTSLPDLLRLMGAVTAIVLLAMFATFALSRLEDIPRSLPAIQWFVLIASMAGSRLAIRIWQERRQASAQHNPGAKAAENVLIVGVNQIAELYLRSAVELAPQKISVVGILAAGNELPGRLLRSQKVLGRPEDLVEISRQLEVHGAPLDRVVVVEPPTRLSSEALEALLDLERSTTIQVHWIQELLGFNSTPHAESSVMVGVSNAIGSDPFAHPTLELSIGKYRPMKRLIDLAGAATLIVLLGPICAVIAALSAFDVGLPIVFWQKRPGRKGRPFKLYKFRTMRGAHDRQGNRIPDGERSSRIGMWLRRTRLDELPQLYNILVGEMSFVGPRPLLPCDQPDELASRLSVRPGLTGSAQAYGDRTMSPNDKNTLDIWYIQNSSSWLDIKIVLCTIMVFLRGERLDYKMLQAARDALEKMRSHGAVGPLIPTGVGDAQSEIIRSVG